MNEFAFVTMLGNESNTRLRPQEPIM